MTEKTLTVMTLALDALSARAIVLIAMLMTFGLFSWAMYESSYLTLTIAGSFAVLVFLPVLWRPHGNSPQ